MDPKQGSHVVQAVGLTKDHANHEKENGDFIKGLVDTQPVVGMLIELLNALFLVEGGIYDPILRHVPVVFEG